MLVTKVDTDCLNREDGITIYLPRLHCGSQTASRVAAARYFPSLGTTGIVAMTRFDGIWDQSLVYRKGPIQRIVILGQVQPLIIFPIKGARKHRTKPQFTHRVIPKWTMWWTGKMNCIYPPAIRNYGFRSRKLGRRSLISQSAVALDSYQFHNYIHINK